MMSEWRDPLAERILNADIIDGRDELGVLLLGHGRGGWWYAATPVTAYPPNAGYGLAGTVSNRPGSVQSM